MGPQLLAGRTFLDHRGRLQLLLSHRGRLTAVASNLSFGPDLAFSLHFAAATQPQVDRMYETLMWVLDEGRGWCGFEILWSNPDVFGLPGAHFTAVTFPHWAPVVLLTTPPALWLAASHWRQVRRRRRGLCVRCGYDLRMSPDRCPECGASAQVNGCAPLSSGAHDPI